MSPEPLSAVKQAKAQLRREALARVRAMSVEARAEASLMICRAAASLPEFHEARCVALFAPLPTEPDIHPLIEEAWTEGKRVVLPLMLKTEKGEPQLNWHAVTSWDEVIVPGPFGLREPDPARCPLVPAKEVDLVFVPGVAFDARGGRLGRGGGYYDRFLGTAPEKLKAIGLMFALQEAAVLPMEEHDCSLVCVITEKVSEQKR